MENRIGSIHIAVSLVEQLQTQINILKRYGQSLLVKAVNLPKLIPGYQQASCGDRTAVSRQIGEVKILALASWQDWQVFEGVTAVVIYSHHHTRMLNVVVWIP